ncbi:MAG TPA: alpha-ketoglutarate-dependent dioxygenase AlkB [Pyrinomonadaceae bacterium]|nr:alpha-ketoglutarate-dependent dioxygenase AlkB [Pyrinomonadaceae bacterium]
MSGLFPLLPPPDGFEYREDMLSIEDEQALVDEIRKLDLKPFDFYGYEAKRRVASFGWRYDYGDRALKDAAKMPEFLIELRSKAGAFCGIDPEKLVMALVSEYAPGTPIGWHRDRPQFDEVVGVSLLSECIFRFRRKIGSKWERHKMRLDPRSMYVLRGPSRSEWEHSIPEVDALRYSITFRSLR